MGLLMKNEGKVSGREMRRAVSGTVNAIDEHNVILREVRIALIDLNKRVKVLEALAGEQTPQQ